MLPRGFLGAVWIVASLALGLAVLIAAAEGSALALGVSSLSFVTLWGVSAVWVMGLLGGQQAPRPRDALARLVDAKGFEAGGAGAVRRAHDWGHLHVRWESHLIAVEAEGLPQGLVIEAAGSSRHARWYRTGHADFDKVFAVGGPPEARLRVDDEQRRLLLGLPGEVTVKDGVVRLGLALGVDGEALGRITDDVADLAARLADDRPLAEVVRVRLARERTDELRARILDGTAEVSGLQEPRERFLDAMHPARVRVAAALVPPVRADVLLACLRDGTVGKLRRVRALQALVDSPLRAQGIAAACGEPDLTEPLFACLTSSDRALAPALLEHLQACPPTHGTARAAVWGALALGDPRVLAELATHLDDAAPLLKVLDVLAETGTIDCLPAIRLVQRRRVSAEVVAAAGAAAAAIHERLPGEHGQLSIPEVHDLGGQLSSVPLAGALTRTEPDELD